MIKRFEVGSRMSQAVLSDNHLHISGQIANNPQATLEQQTREVLAKVDKLLSQAGTDKSKLISVTVLLAHISDFDAMNRVYEAWIDRQNPPARACYEARLASPNLRVEVTAIAAL